MKILLLSGWLALALAASAGALEPAPPTMASLDQETHDLSDQLRSATEEIADLQKRLDAVEKRLGESYRPSSPFDTVERRLDDIEKDVDSLKRR
ncbi:MAG: hypothetical protein EOM72_10350 [Opitutae bacterium]|nr:hypothetical protein [Opitutae bacterium]